jgi:hypothetical protein
MTYLRIKNWEHYQNADVFKKSGGRPPWVKLFIRRDLELDGCCIEARILFYELLKVSGDYANVISNDLKWISTETRLPLNVVAKGLPVLLQGAWLSETKSPRRSRKIRESFATRSRTEVEKKSTSAKAQKGKLHLVAEACPECFCGGGLHTVECSSRAVG